MRRCRTRSHGEQTTKRVRESHLLGEFAVSITLYKGIMQPTIRKCDDS